MGGGQNPTYDLARIKAGIQAGTYWITHSALNGAMELGLDRTDVIDCVMELGAGDFYKTMAATTKVGLMQDVYKRTYQGHHLYVKLQNAGTPTVVSFKKDESS